MGDTSSLKRLLKPYAVSLAYMGLALLMRDGIELFVPGVAHFVILLPAVVLAGATCGSWPAIVAAVFGGTVFAVLFIGRPLLSGPPLNAGQMDILLFALACLSVLWVTSALRGAAIKAQEAEARLTEVFRQIPGAAAIISAPKGKLLIRSAHSDQILGHSAQQVASTADLGRYQAFDSDGRAYAADAYPIARALRTGEVVSAERLKYHRPNGDRAELEVYAGPVRNREGRIVAAVGMAFDVTERALVELRLAQSEREYRALSQRLQTALDAAALGLWELDRKTGRHSWDARTATMFGLPSQAITFDYDEIERFVAPDERQRLRDELKLALANGGVYTAELQARTVQGDRRWFILSGMESVESGRVTGVVRDITDDRQREQALRGALHARELLFREADHRIKNSLQLVVSLLSLQKRRLTDPDAVDVLADAIARVNAVADAHLALQQSPDLRTIALDRMLRDLCTRLNTLDPLVAISCETPDTIILDAEQAIPLGLLTSELVTNALRHAFRANAPGTIAVMVRQDEAWLELVVADDGIGLPPEAVRSGLGTTILKALSMKLEASVATQSEPGRGVRVSVRFRPRIRPDEVPA